MKFKMKMLFAILGIITFSVQCGDEHENHDDHSHHEHSHHGKDHLIPAGDAAPGSLLDLNGEWYTERGLTFDFKKLKGKMFILSMFYASCQSICPRIVNDIQQIEKQIEGATGEKPMVVLASFDHVNDMPEALLKYKSKMDMGDNWVLLNGGEDSVRTLSVALGINYKKTSNGEFNHSAIVGLVSKDGVVVSRVEGVGAKADKLVEKFKKLN